jgi:hypothetical protein
MLMATERRPAIRTLREWAISVLQEAGAIRECEERGWMQDRADPHGASGPSNSPTGMDSCGVAIMTVAEVLEGIGDTPAPSVPATGDVSTAPPFELA